MQRASYGNALDSSGNVSRWAVGVTTAPRTEPTLGRSLQSLAEAGWPRPHLFAEPDAEIPAEFTGLNLTRRGCRLGAFPNWLLALSELVMQQPRAEAYLLCQDDVIYSRGLRGYLESRLWPAHDVGVVSVYCPSHDSNGETAGFRAIDRGWDAWGALAYVFPNRSARALLSDAAIVNHRHHGPADGLRNIDSVVGNWCRRQSLPYFIHVPSLAQHIGGTSTIWNSARAQGRRRARDFNESIVSEAAHDRKEESPVT